MILKAGTVTDMNDSMAQAIADAFKETWPTVLDGEPEESDQMKLLFVAVAKGVVNYLADHADAFEIIFPKIDDQDYTATLKINK